MAWSQLAILMPNGRRLNDSLIRHRSWSARKNKFRLRMCQNSRGSCIPEGEGASMSNYSFKSVDFGVWAAAQPGALALRRFTAGIIRSALS